MYESKTCLADPGRPLVRLKISNFDVSSSSILLVHTAVHVTVLHNLPHSARLLTQEDRSSAVNQLCHGAQDVEGNPNA